MRPRINAIVPKSVDASPAPWALLAPLLVDNKYRDVLQRICEYLATHELVTLLRVNKQCLDVGVRHLRKTLFDPIAVLNILAKMNKSEISKFLRQYFFYGSDYYKHLDTFATHADLKRPAYALKTLTHSLAYLNAKRVQGGLNWLKHEKYPDHLIHSVRMVKLALAYRANEYFCAGLTGNYHCYLNLQGVNFQRLFPVPAGPITLANMDLMDANFDYASMNHVTFSRVSFIGASFQYTKLQNIQAEGIDFSFAHMQFASLQGANLKGAKLISTDLRMADLTGADLTCCDATRVQLQGASLDKANLSRAKMPHASLHRSNLSMANLTLANMFNADMSKARLFFTNLFMTDCNHTDHGGIKGNAVFGDYAHITDRVAPEPVNKRLKP